MEQPISLRESHLVLKAQSAKGVSAILPGTGGRVRELAVLVVYSKGSRGGEVMIEAGPASDFTGKWAPLTKVPWIEEDRAHYRGITGAQFVTRVRLTQPVVGGSVDVYSLGN